MTGYRLQCCDCGLVHRMDFRLHKGQIQFRVFFDGRATKAAREKWWKSQMEGATKAARREGQG